MKTITIPEYKNPFIVVINNKVYQYRAGETIEVPDEVAEAIEDALELEPKPKRYLSRIAQFAEGNITKLTASDLDGIEKIVYYAFVNYDSFESVEIPSSVISIGYSAFSNCSSLKKVIFEGNSNLKTIGTNAFDWCENLEEVYLPETPPTLSNVNAFDHIKANCTFYCKTQSSLEAYKVADNWRTLKGTYSFAVEE